MGALANRRGLDRLVSTAHRVAEAAPFQATARHIATAGGGPLNLAGLNIHLFALPPQIFPCQPSVLSPSSF